MNIKELFNDFVNIKIYGSGNPIPKTFDRYKDFVNKVEHPYDIQLSFDDIGFSISHVSSNKVGLMTIHNAFINYVKKATGLSIESQFGTAFMANVRRIELIKYLQVPHSNEEIQDEFLIKQRTLDNDWKALETGIEFGGQILKVKRKTYGEDRYTIDDDGANFSLNPIAVTYNMTELYILMKMVPKAINHPKLKEAYEELMNKMLFELTPRAKELLKIEDKDIEMTVEQSEHAFTKQKLFNQLSYCFKAGCKCSIEYEDNGETKIVRDVNVKDGSNLDSVIVKGNPDFEIKYEDIHCVLDFDNIYC